MEDDEEQSLKLQTEVMKAFLAYTEHCKAVYLKKLDDEQSSDEDEVFLPPKETNQDIKKPYIPEPFSENLIASQLNS